ncbi:MAG TPA: monofunctional biosynthetic peptidoglycan transglycosylase [Rhodocyclaceae bacterium]|nr:monofunctional biosynthetic peptidoglycan transglycosylase [Rhodocyclaceae bacterium]
MKTTVVWIKRGLLFLLALAVIYQLWLLGWVLLWKWVNPGETRFMEIRMEELRVKVPDARAQHQWLPYARISPHLKRAIIAAEDGKFVEHGGFDWEGIQNAIEKNQKKGRFVAGGSTISQQLAKNLFLSPTRSLFRKAEEAVITVMIETLWDKERILEVYLNVIEWGHGVFGAEAAARHHYGVSAAQLSPDQAARLAAMVPSPRFYDRNRNAPSLGRRTATIRARMGGAVIP